MARSTKNGEKRIFAVVDRGGTLLVQGFSDVYETTDGFDAETIHTAEQNAQAFLSQNASAVVIDGASTAEQAIELYRNRDS